MKYKEYGIEFGNGSFEDLAAYMANPGSVERNIVLEEHTVTNPYEAVERFRFALSMDDITTAYAIMDMMLHSHWRLIGLNMQRQFEEAVTQQQAREDLAYRMRIILAKMAKLKAVPCSGCPGGWCANCVPDTDVINHQDADETQLFEPSDVFTEAELEEIKHENDDFMSLFDPGFEFEA